MFFVLRLSCAFMLLILFPLYLASMEKELSQDISIRYKEVYIDFLKEELHEQIIHDTNDIKSFNNILSDLQSIHALDQQYLDDCLFSAHSLEKIKILTFYGANLNANYRLEGKHWGEKVLHVALMNEKVDNDVIAYFLEIFGAESRTKQGDTLWHTLLSKGAVWYCKEAFFKLRAVVLKKYQVPLHWKDQFGHSAIDEINKQMEMCYLKMQQEKNPHLNASYNNIYLKLHTFKLIMEENALEQKMDS